MKKFFFAILVCLAMASDRSFAAAPEQSSAIVGDHAASTVVKNLIAQFFIGGIALWASGEILADMGHRYMFCKEIALKYAEELRQDSAHNLSECEISFWSLVQGLSAAPRIWWREITATALLVGFIASARKMLITQ